MALYTHTKGGTGAGRKREYPRLKDWVCAACQAEVRKHWARCPVCGERRPDA